MVSQYAFGRLAATILLLTAFLYSMQYTLGFTKSKWLSTIYTKPCTFRSQTLLHTSNFVTCTNEHFICFKHFTSAWILIDISSMFIQSNLFLLYISKELFSSLKSIEKIWTLTHFLSYASYDKTLWMYIKVFYFNLCI